MALKLAAPAGLMANMIVSIATAWLLHYYYMTIIMMIISISIISRCCIMIIIINSSSIIMISSVIIVSSSSSRSSIVVTISLTLLKDFWGRGYPRKHAAWVGFPCESYES